MHRVGIRISRRMRKKAVQQGRSEVRDAKHNERQVRGRARVGERPVSRDESYSGSTVSSEAMRERRWWTFSASC